MRNADGSFDIIVGAPRAARATGCRPAAWTIIVLVLRLYDTPVGVATRAAREAPMPSHQPERSLPMIRWRSGCSGALLLGGIVHLVDGADPAAHCDAGRLFAALPDRAGQCGHRRCRSPRRRRR